MGSADALSFFHAKSAVPGYGTAQRGGEDKEKVYLIISAGQAEMSLFGGSGGRSLPFMALNNPGLCFPREVFLSRQSVRH